MGLTSTLTHSRNAIPFYQARTLRSNFVRSTDASLSLLSAVTPDYWQCVNHAGLADPNTSVCSSDFCHFVGAQHLDAIEVSPQSCCWLGWTSWELKDHWQTSHGLQHLLLRYDHSQPRYRNKLGPVSEEYSRSFSSGKNSGADNVKHPKFVNIPGFVPCIPHCFSVASLPVANKLACAQDCESGSQCLRQSASIRQQLLYHSIRLLLLSDFVATCYSVGPELNIDSHRKVSSWSIERFCVLFYFAKPHLWNTDLLWVSICYLPKTLQRLGRYWKVTHWRICTWTRHAQTSPERIHRNRTRCTTFRRQHSFHAKK